MLKTMVARRKRVRMMVGTEKKAEARASNKGKVKTKGTEMKHECQE